MHSDQHETGEQFARELADYAFMDDTAETFASPSLTVRPLRIPAEVHETNARNQENRYKLRWCAECGYRVARALSDYCGPCAGDNWFIVSYTAELATETPLPDDSAG